MIPFAMAQGGNATKENLWGEIDNLLGKKSLVRTGMEKAMSTSFAHGTTKRVGDSRHACGARRRARRVVRHT